MNIIRIIQALARKNVIQKNNKTGITSIPNRMNAEGEAGSIAAQLQDAGLPLEQADKIIKSEQDLIRVLNQIDQAPIQQNIENVIPFPQGGKDRLSPFDDFKASEDIYEQAQNLTPIAAMKEANNLIGRKGKYKNISSEDAKKQLGKLEEIIKSEKLEPEDLVGDDLGDMLNDYDGDPDAMAMGGLAGLLGEEPRSEYSGGGDTGAPPITYNDNVGKSGPGPSMPPNTMMNTPAIDPRMLNQGRGSGIFIDPRGLQNGKIPLPTQGLADGGRIGLSAGGGITRLLKFLKKFKKKKTQSQLFEEDMAKIKKEMEIENKKFYEGLKPGGELEQNIEKSTGYQFPDTDEIRRVLKKKLGNREDNILKEFDTTGRKPNAMGGRIGFKNGGMDRRTFLKLMGGLASLPVVGKLFKGAKVASKVVPLKNTSTVMPAWFPDLVDKFVAKGVAKKIDEDIIQYEIKELPGIKMTKHDDGRIYVEGQNDYSRGYDIEYQPPGYEVVDYKTGKAVKTKGDFTASEEVPVNMDPDGNADFEGEILEEVGDILTSDGRVMEEFATGTKLKTSTRGEHRVGQAEVAAENAADDAAERAAMEADDFAKGGLAGQLL